jgi:hypothetical protein
MKYVFYILLVWISFSFTLVEVKAQLPVFSTGNEQGVNIQYNPWNSTASMNTPYLKFYKHGIQTPLQQYNPYRYARYYQQPHWRGMPKMLPGYYRQPSLYSIPGYRYLLPKSTIPVGKAGKNHIYFQQRNYKPGCIIIQGY